MTPNPILKVLSTLKRHNVRCLLIGGQASIIYGAVEFSRDSDFVILSTDENLKYLREALSELKAELIYVPPLEKGYLEKGHACHFRCMADEVKHLRVDIISKLQGCDSFDELWTRKNTISVNDETEIDVIGMKDLVQSKKTQRDKDWDMLKRLVENDILLNKDNPSNAHVEWWFSECRNLDTLIDIGKKYPDIIKGCVGKRPLLSWAIASEEERLGDELDKEERMAREKDREYWKPLRKELEALRHRAK